MKSGTRDSSGPFVIRSATQIRALASPARQEIVDALVAAGPASIGDLAGLLGRAADSLYFHVKVLIRVGLVVEAGERREGRHAAALYDVPARPLMISYERPRARGFERVIGSALRLAYREYRRGLADDTCVAQGPCRNLWAGRAKGWVDETELLRLNELLRELFTTVHSGRPGPGRKAVSFSCVLAPPRVAPRPAHRVGARKGAAS
ncbi:MAG: helix-turn-helix transcriptional regulator [Phycisphaerae bacterium]|nr:helix-turn-helix transcriptional regulator [Phycisphaerae bacterium]